MTGHESSNQCNLILSKALFFVTALSTVGWNRFQNNFFIENGLSNSDIGLLKSVGLLSKIVGEPVLCMIADQTNLKIVFFVAVLMSILTMELLRTSSPLTFEVVMYVKLLRTFVSPVGTLTTTSALHLIRGSKQGFGEQRAFGSMAWGIGALCIGYFIDVFGINVLFYYTYSLNILMLMVILVAVPSKATTDVHSSYDSSIALNSGDDSENTRALQRKESISMTCANTNNPGLLPFSEAQVLTEFDNSEDEDIPLLWNDATGTWAKIVHDRHSSGTVQELGEQNIASVSTVSSAIKVLCEMWRKFYVDIRLHLTPYIRLIREPTLQSLQMNVLVYGSVMTVVDTFLYVGIEREFKASRTFNGLMTAVSVLGAVPAFWHSDKIIKRYGHSLSLLGSEAVCAVRLFLSAIVWALPPSPALLLLLLLQLSHSICFALYWACVVDLVSNAASAGVLNGAVAMISSLYFTVGGSLGNILWGYLYDYFGSMIGVFLVAGAVTAALVVAQKSKSFGILHERVTK